LSANQTTIHNTLFEVLISDSGKLNSLYICYWSSHTFRNSNSTLNEFAHIYVYRVSIFLREPSSHITVRKDWYCW